MRILFAGTPEIAVPSLQAVAREFEVAAVLTNPDKRKGRSKKLIPPPVKKAALELEIPVYQFTSLRTEARESISQLHADVLAVFAYGRIFGPKFLSLFPKGGLNVHPSLLPAYRGSSPIPASILSGDNMTGISIQRIAREMDTGDIIKQKVIPLNGTETSSSLSQTAAEEGAELLVEALRDIQSGNAVFTPQNESKATYCSMISKDDGWIDWQTESTDLIDRKIRAYYPWPKAAAYFDDKKLMFTDAEVYKKVNETEVKTHSEQYPPGTVVRSDTIGIIVSCRDGFIRIKRLQLQSKNEMDWKSFLNGNPDFIGTILR